MKERKKFYPTKPKSYCGGVVHKIGLIVAILWKSGYGYADSYERNLSKILKEADKTVMLGIPNITKEKESFSLGEVLGLGWSTYINDTLEHRENIYRYNNYRVHQNKPIIIMVAESGVLFHKFEVTWLDVDDLESTKREMHPLFLSKDSKITAFHMETQGDLLTLVTEKRKITILNVRRSQSQEHPFIEMQFDLGKEFASEPGVVNSIGLIPYSNYYILAPSYYSLIKLDRLGPIIENRVRSPLDKIKFIVLPVPTSNPEMEPYTGFPDQFDKRFVENSLTSLFRSSRTMALTSADTEYTALVDWTNLKIINYFTVRKNNEKYFNPSEYVVTSICFYGAVPVAHTYALMTRHTHKQIVLFDGIFNLYKGVVNLQTDYQNTELTWLNGTTYILACQHNDGDTRCHPTLVDFSPLRPENYTLNFSRGDFTLPVKSHFQMMTFKMLDTFDSLSVHLNLNHIFLTLNREGNRIVIKPPFFSWGVCLDSSLDNFTKKSKMLIGLSRFCRNLPKKALEFAYTFNLFDDTYSFLQNYRKNHYSLYEIIEETKNFRSIHFEGNLFYLNHFR